MFRFTRYGNNWSQFFYKAATVIVWKCCIKNSREIKPRIIARYNCYIIIYYKDSYGPVQSMTCCLERTIPNLMSFISDEKIRWRIFSVIHVLGIKKDYCGEEKLPINEWKGREFQQNQTERNNVQNLWPFNALWGSWQEPLPIPASDSPWEAIAVHHLCGQADQLLSFQ